MKLSVVTPEPLTVSVNLLWHLSINGSSAGTRRGWIMGVDHTAVMNHVSPRTLEKGGAGQPE